MVAVNNVTVSFGGFSLFENISFLVNPKDRIGLAGKNGAGKSTLLKLMAGEQNPTKGEISKPKDFRIGYLPQDMIHQHGRTVIEETSTAFQEINGLKELMENINLELTHRTDYETNSYSDLINTLSETSARLDILGEGNIQEAMEKILKGLGFSRSDFDRKTDEFSGGWRMRIELAKLLLQKPELLLLDEPTNHLDIEAIQWLEDFMETYYGAVVLISHDKKFLDNVTTRTIEISNRKIFDYRANYSKYLVLRKERRDQLESAAKNQQKIIDHTEALIDKYRAKANKAAFAQSLIKKLDRMERVETDEEDNTAMHFRFPPPAHSGKIVLTVEEVKKVYGQKLIFEGADFIITKGEKVAFVGKNGEGKSTMMKMIGGKTSIEGKLILGHGVKPGVFEQDQEEKLDPNKTIFETIDELAAGEIRKQVRNILGSFLFSGDDIDKKVRVLSGGERGRLALCKLLLEPYNLLLLDEPTNHLDIRSKEILKRAIQNYEGTVIIVSHDRDFLSDLTNRLFEFRDGKVREHLYGINEFMERRRVEIKEAEREKAGTPENVVKEIPVKVQMENKTSIGQVQKSGNGGISKNALRNCEAQIMRVEGEIKVLEEKIEKMQEGSSFDQGVFEQMEKLKKELQGFMQEWEVIISSIKA